MIHYSMLHRQLSEYYLVTGRESELFYSANMKDETCRMCCTTYTCLCVYTDTCVQQSGRLVLSGKIRTGRKNGLLHPEARTI
jgi:hypothetical protein